MRFRLKFISELGKQDSDYWRFQSSLEKGKREFPKCRDLSSGKQFGEFGA
jgi:hypothetical protein